ncbi:kinase-like protein, partial [Coniophora puteana RWD-64-598 SS2]
MDTQQETQQDPGQLAHADPQGTERRVWGVLQPCSPALKSIEFCTEQKAITIGRNPEKNVVVLPGLRVSNEHCEIRWDSRLDEKSHITVYDTSNNGTWINGFSIGKGRSRILKDGNEIAFGHSVAQPERPLEDYRFIYRHMAYRHMASGPPKVGLHAFYDIGHEIGKGSFATVVRGLSLQTGKWYAVKIINLQTLKRTQPGSGSSGSSGARENNKMTVAFAREVSILQKLQHKNICLLKEVFFEESTISKCLVLELVEGGDLLDYICLHTYINEPLACHITYQIADALTYVHALGIVHRDLKPENVLLTTESPPNVKVADFGLARIVDSETYMQTMCGTPSYLAPDVVTQKNSEGYNHLIDAWSVGVIVFTMLTGQTPFIEDKTINDIKIRIAERKVDWGILRDAHPSQDAQDFIQSLLQYLPENRMPIAMAQEHPWLATY